MDSKNTWVRNKTPLQNVSFVLGDLYEVQYGSRILLCKFIKVTNMGYNFLHINSNMCVYPKHLYIPRKWQSRCKGPIKKFIIPASRDIRSY